MLSPRIPFFHFWGKWREREEENVYSTSIVPILDLFLFTPPPLGEVNVGGERYDRDLGIYLCKSRGFVLESILSWEVG